MQSWRQPYNQSCEQYYYKSRLDILQKDVIIRVSFWYANRKFTQKKFSINVPRNVRIQRSKLPILFDHGGRPYIYIFYFYTYHIGHLILAKPTSNARFSFQIGSRRICRRKKLPRLLLHRAKLQSFTEESQQNRNVIGTHARIVACLKSNVWR